jgi:hypothetical protein
MNNEQCTLEEAVKFMYLPEYAGLPIPKLMTAYARQQRRDALQEFVRRVADMHCNGGSLGYPDAMQAVAKEMNDG